MPKNQALQDFLTAKRAAITPEQAGLASSGARRVPGLRREEVAMLAGVSTDWYTRLEQGRDVTPSRSVLDALARVLRLDGPEHDYLTNLAQAGTAAPQGPDRPTVRPGIARMVEAFEHQPAFVLGPRMEVLTGNAAAWALLTDFPARPEHDRNLLRWVATDPAAQDLYLDWEEILTDLVGVLQLEASAAPADPRLRALVAELQASSPAFARLWQQPRPQGRTCGTKRFDHPQAGPLRIDWEAFGVPDDAGQTLFVYTAADEASADALAQITTAGATTR